MLYYIKMHLILILSFGFSACSKFNVNNVETNKINSSPKQQDILAADLHSKQQEDLTKIYTQAIAEFIKCAYVKDKITFDTLFFGKHIYGQPDDFPNIELPKTIEKTQIRLITPEVGQKMQNARKSLVYINLMGWVERQKAEFIFVVFSNGAKHQYDYFINFTYNSKSRKFELEKIEFENYLDTQGKNPKRIDLYSHGKYVVNNQNHQ